MTEPRPHPRARAATRPATRPSLPRFALLTAMVAALALVVGACAAPAASTAPSAAPASVAAPEVVASGEFHDVDGSATGMVALKHLADGSFTVVLEDFETAGIDHTNVVMVTNADVAATTDIDQSAILDLGPLKAANGMQDYSVPSEMSADAMGYQSVVLWDTAMLHALAAAPLTEP